MPQYKQCVEPKLASCKSANNKQMEMVIKGATMVGKVVTILCETEASSKWIFIWPSSPLIASLDMVNKGATINDMIVTLLCETCQK